VRGNALSMPTPNLALIPLAAAQSQKHVTVNEAFARLDAAAQPTVQDRTRTAPPPDPKDGDRHLIASPANGAWASREDDIAAWDAASQGWLFLTPHDGWQVWVIEDRMTWHFDGAAWTPVRPAQLGVNASSDATNRLAVASDAVLFNHNGSGVRAKLNKASATDTASILFQTGFTGHAEIGLTGGTDLQFKTSADGSTFTDAITFEAATGHATLPAGATIRGLNVHPDMVLNLLPDQGRFGGVGANMGLRAVTFTKPRYLQALNGSTLSGHARFIHNNETYGGNAGVLAPEIDALLALIRPSVSRRRGAEWWTIKVTKGTGSSDASTLNGVTRHLALRTLFSPMPQSFTTGLFVRSLSGSVYIDQRDTTRFFRWERDETGNPSAGVVVPSDGWVFIQRQMTSNAEGYNVEAFQLELESVGDEALIALPRFVAGHAYLDPYLPGPLVNDRLFG